MHIRIRAIDTTNNWFVSLEFYWFYGPMSIQFFCFFFNYKNELVFEAQHQATEDRDADLLNRSQYIKKPLDYITSCYNGKFHDP